MTAKNKLSVYESIMERIKHDIALGILAEGEKLPSCRELALEMGVNPNTVQRAYSALEEQGVIYTIPKKGVYVKHAQSDVNMLKEAEAQIRRLTSAGVTRAQLEAVIESIFLEENHD